MEIMSPVGSFEALYAAIQGGADAVYFGVGQLNMRSRSAANFNLDDLQLIVEICKEHNIRSYLALNTIVYDDELMQIRIILDLAKKVGVSAVIASDMSVIIYARKINLEVHISTQCNITNIEALQFYSQFADVMVTARELSLNQVADIVKGIEKLQIKGPSGNLVQIEVFAHGALCMAVSGKCYLSLDNYNESANRGKCLQLCRRVYKLTDIEEGVEIEVDNQYLMSPKDLKTLDFLPQIIDAGVKVLKIEGRGRSADYVKTVTRVYREAVDLLEGKNEIIKNDELRIQKFNSQLSVLNSQLSTIYNRGFWNGYYLGQKSGEWANSYGSKAAKRKEYIGKITNFFSNISVAEIKIETGNISIGDEILIIGETTGVYEDVLKEIRVDLNTVETAKKGDLCSIKTETIVRRGDKVYKLSEV